MTAPSTFFFDVVLQPAETSSPLRALGPDPYNFIVDVDYRVAGICTMEQEHQLGLLRTQNLLVGAALNEGVCMFDAADSQSRELQDLVELMYDPQSGWLAEDFVDVMGADQSSTDVCYVRSDDILDLACGPYALRILAQHTTAGHLAVGVQGLRHPRNADELTRALVRSSKLQALGFTRYAQTPFFFLNLAYKIPELPEYLELNASEAAEV